jgi:predicted nucleic acid-binding protein
MRYLLDTNICIYIAKRKPGRVLFGMLQVGGVLVLFALLENHDVLRG